MALAIARRYVLFETDGEHARQTDWVICLQLVVRQRERANRHGQAYNGRGSTPHCLEGRLLEIVSVVPREHGTALSPAVVGTEDVLRLSGCITHRAHAAPVYQEQTLWIRHHRCVPEREMSDVCLYNASMRRHI